MKQMKRLLSVVLALVMALGLLAATAPAANAASSVSFYTQPTSVACNAGDTVQFKAVAQNVPFDQSIQWQMRTSENTEWVDMNDDNAPWATGYTKQILKVTTSVELLKKIPEFRCRVHDVRNGEINGTAYSKAARPLWKAVWIGGTVLQDGEYLANGSTTVSTIKPASHYAYYKDGVLTLSQFGYRGAGAYNYLQYSNYVIYCDTALTITLDGDSFIIPQYGSGDVTLRGIFVNKDLTINGSGSLTGDTDNIAISSGNGKLTIEDAKVEVSSRNFYGVSAYMDVVIKNAEVHAYGGYSGINSSNSSVLIDNSTVEASGTRSGIFGTSITIQNGSTVDATSMELNGLRASQKNIVITDSTVTARSYSDTEPAICPYAGSLVIGEGLNVKAAVNVSGTPGEFSMDDLATYHLVTIEAAKEGWVQEDGNWYFYENNTPKTGWLKDGGYWYYMNAEGAMQTGWVKSGNYWYYMNKSGVMTTGWVKVGNYWYYMNSNGVMQTGWQTIGGQKYYFTSGGTMATGLTKIDGKTYCFASGGSLQIGWANVGGKWYFTNASGIVQTGWVSAGGKWYYMDANGVMQTGWQTIGGKKYYFTSGGAMATGLTKIDGKTYCFASGGSLQTGWISVGGKWYYANTSGVIQTGWVSVGGKWYYMDANGVMQTGWVKVGNYWYYMNQSGAMVTGTQVIDGKTYKFNSNGVWIG